MQFHKSLQIAPLWIDFYTPMNDHAKGDHGHLRTTPRKVFSAKGGALLRCLAKLIFTKIHKNVLPDYCAPLPPPPQRAISFQNVHQLSMGRTKAFFNYCYLDSLLLELNFY